jgi:uroporphyrinogen-III synthase
VNAAAGIPSGAPETPARATLRVAVTRDEDASGELSAALRARGLEPVSCPVVASAPPPEPERLQEAARHLERYDWLIVASRRALEAVLAARDERPLPQSLRTAAVGPRTAAALARWSAQPPIVPERSGAAALIEVLRQLGPWSGKRCLLPRALDGGTELGCALRAMGAAVDEIAAYRTIERSKKEIATAWTRARAEAVVIASPSAARALVGAVGVAALVRLTLVMAIGDTTRDALAGLGLAARVSPRADFDSVAETISAFASQRGTRT